MKEIHEVNIEDTSDCDMPNNMPRKYVLKPNRNRRRDKINSSNNVNFLAFPGFLWFCCCHCLIWLEDCRVQYFIFDACSFKISNMPIKNTMLGSPRKILTFWSDFVNFSSKSSRNSSSFFCNLLLSSLA